ncbi:hypothetical protein GCM10025864_05010 [Luteimicrobium album]|uniref:Uncharacterized protein n=1 Tax=Luteimicrobium album TaxID=1054550 RepID=A0ABQ6HXQ0_9MICO|nr:hypothetical protein GCM10025864_05010 [Luteimicrobium album]
MREEARVVRMQRAGLTDESLASERSGTSAIIDGEVGRVERLKFAH